MSCYSFRTKDTPKLGLLMVILSVIFMNGNKASEGEWLGMQLNKWLLPEFQMLIFCPCLLLASSCSYHLGRAAQVGATSWV